MVLLSGLMRAAAVTGRPETIFTHVTARQGGRWAEQTVGAAVRPGPGSASRPERDPAEALKELTEMQQRGLLTEDEVARARRGLGL